MTSVTDQPKLPHTALCSLHATTERVPRLLHLPRHSHYSGVIPMVFEHSGVYCRAAVELYSYTALYSALYRVDAVFCCERVS